MIAAAVAAVESHGGGSGASRLVTGTLPVHDDLEATLAGLLGSPAALVLSTGYAANLAALTTLTDADTLVVSDAHAHASLIDGCRLSRAGRVAVSRHNDLDHIAELLSGRAEGRAVVVAESIYSVLGDAAPVSELVDLTRAQGAVLVIDEAHAVGVCGVRDDTRTLAAAAAASDAPGRALDLGAGTGYVGVYLAQRGWDVLLVERDRLPRHKVCGEFLSPEAQGSLAQLGVLDDVAALAPEVPDDAILSRTFYKDDRLSAMVFSFAPGQELSEHTAAVPAIIHIISGRARLTLGEDATTAEAGTWVHMTPRLPHSVVAETPVVMLLLMLR